MSAIPTLGLGPNIYMGFLMVSRTGDEANLLVAPHVASQLLSSGAPKEGLTAVVKWKSRQGWFLPSDGEGGAQLRM